MAFGHRIEWATGEDLVHKRIRRRERSPTWNGKWLPKRYHCLRLEPTPWDAAWEDRERPCSRRIEFLCIWQWTDPRRGKACTTRRQSCRHHAQIFADRQKIRMPK